MLTVAVITGASRGLGAELARLLACDTSRLVLLGRNADALKVVADDCTRRRAGVVTVPIDLASAAAEHVVAAALTTLPWREASRAMLFNNASKITPISNLDRIAASDADALVSLDVTAAIWMTSRYVALCREHEVDNAYVINISSGASVKALPGWGLYCIAKAAINMLTQVVVEDTRTWAHPVRSVAVNPGPMDTEMQSDIRRADAEHCPQAKIFVDMHGANALPSAADAARRVLSMVDEQPFPDGAYIDLRAR